jgi:hypothetical protein
MDQRDLVKVVVKSLDGRSTIMDVDDNITIFEFKQQLTLFVGVEAEQMQLVFNARGMWDARTLKHCSIGDGSVVHIVLNLRGD